MKIKNLININTMAKLVSISFANPMLNFKIMKLSKQCNEYYEFIQSERIKALDKLKIKNTNNVSKEQEQEFNKIMFNILETDLEICKFSKIEITEKDIETCSYNSDKIYWLSANEWSEVLNFLNEINKQIDNK